MFIAGDALLRPICVLFLEGFHVAVQTALINLIELVEELVQKMVVDPVSRWENSQFE